MSNGSTSNILNALQQGLNFIETAAPVAAALGGPQVAAVANIAGLIAETAGNMVAAAEEGGTVFTSTDKGEIARIISTLQARNDASAQAIANS